MGSPISVAIVNHDGARYLPRTLEAIERCGPMLAEVLPGAAVSRRRVGSFPARCRSRGFGRAFGGSIVLFFAASVDRERRAVSAFAAGVMLNLSANLWAIPRHGALGVAWYTVMTQTLIAVRLTFEGFRAIRERRVLEVVGGAQGAIDG